MQEFYAHLLSLTRLSSSRGTVFLFTGRGPFLSLYFYLPSFRSRRDESDKKTQCDAHFFHLQVCMSSLSLSLREKAAKRGRDKERIKKWAHVSFREELNPRTLTKNRREGCFDCIHETRGLHCLKRRFFYAKKNRFLSGVHMREMIDTSIFVKNGPKLPLSCQFSPLS